MEIFMYTEKPMEALPYRRRIIDETNAWIEAMRKECDAVREDYFAPNHASSEAYEASTCKYRKELAEMLGYPLSHYNEFPTPQKEECIHIGEDEYGYIDRLWVEVLPGLFSYGLLFTPRGNGKFPLVVTLHGGEGTPEIVSSFYKNSVNYNHLVNRIREKADVMVYAPQLILWKDEYADESSRSGQNYDEKLKQIGSSSAAMEIFKILRAVDYISASCPVDVSRIGIAGLSYGGFYTLFTSAIDTRFKSVLSSCWFNNRYAYPWADMTWFGAASKMLDTEVASLICPRSLCIQIGKQDPVFEYTGALANYRKVEEHYEKLGIPEKFKFNLFEGSHEVDTKEDDIIWFVEHLTRK